MTIFQDLATWKEMNIQTDGYEEEGEYLHGRDTFNYFSDIFHISHGPHEGQKYQDLITNSNTLSKKTSFPYFGVKLSCVCLMFAYRKKSNDLQ